jgi:hypothetical protein
MKLTLLLCAQLALTQEQAPVLSFPESGMDDSIAYRGYQTRFHRDAASNTIQVYLDSREARVVHVLANSENESIGFSARDRQGRAAALRWASERATVSANGRQRSIEYVLQTDVPVLQLGWFLLGSMRVERDFQAWGRHRAPLGGRPFSLPETTRLLAALARLDADRQRRHLATLGATSLASLRTRLGPSLLTTNDGGEFTARVTQPSIDARDTLSIEISTDTARVRTTVRGGVVTLRSRSVGPLSFRVRIATTAAPLTPLARDEIFTPDFLRFLAEARAPGGSSAADESTLRARWLERQVRGVELLASREKLMAGLPTYGTYFGRDMLVSALLMWPVWRPEMAEFAVASALRKLSSGGEVSHEEALGGQAVREGAAEYAAIVDQSLAAGPGERATSDSLWDRAIAVLRNLRRPREAYHMIDDEFQLPVLAARWLDDPRVSQERKLAFLHDSSDGGGPRLDRLGKALGVVARLARPYAEQPLAKNLVSFPASGDRWASASWRDSKAGYAGGRYAMDVNAIWVPHALDGLARILSALRSLGLAPEALAQQFPDLAPWARDSLALRSAIGTWLRAERHFLVRLDSAQWNRRLAARLAVMAPAERAHWRRSHRMAAADNDGLTFLAIALDGDGLPIPIANSDPATRLFLGDLPSEPDAMGRAERDVRVFVREFPVGLLVDGVGPVAANDAYAAPSAWRAFDGDPYHGPRVVWGREVNLLLSGLSKRLLALGDSVGARAGHAEAADSRHVRELRDALHRVARAVDASGFHNELWSFEVAGGRARAVRYGTGADVQLWSTTNLAVQFLLSKLPQ